MRKNEMLLMLIQHYSHGNKAQFAQMLGMKPQNINAWLVRDTWDVDTIYAKCEDLSGDWLLNGGKGEMLRKPQVQKEEGSLPQRDMLDIIKNQAQALLDQQLVISSLIKKA